MIDLTLFVVFTCSIVCIVVFTGLIGSFISLEFELPSSSSEIFHLSIIYKFFHNIRIYFTF